MHDSFWFGTSLGDLFFSGLTVNTTGAMVGTCFFFFFFTIVFECFKVIESRLRKDHNSRMRQALEGACAGDRSNLLANNSAIPGPSSNRLDTKPPPSTLIQNKYLLKLCQVSVYTVNTSINYLIMLAVMLFNGYIVIAIILGITLGYFVSGHIKSAYNMEMIMEKQQTTVTVCAPGCEEPDESTPPLSRVMGQSEAQKQYSCETRAQMQRLLDRSPTNSSDEQSNQDAQTEVTIVQEQVDVHAADKSVIIKESVSDVNTSSCCKDVTKSSSNDDKNIISCCGSDKDDIVSNTNENVDVNFIKPCSEKNKDEKKNDDE